MLPLHLCCCLLLPYFHNGYDYGSCTYTDVAVYSSPGHPYANSLQCCHLLLFQLSPAHTPLTQTSILCAHKMWTARGKQKQRKIGQNSGQHKETTLSSIQDVVD